MKWLAGFSGALVGGTIFFGAKWLASLYAPLITDTYSRSAIFFILLFFSFLEIPVMIFGLRQIARAKSTRLFALVTAGFTSFGPVYGAIYVLLTQENDWANVFAALVLVRLVSLIWVR